MTDLLPTTKNIKANILQDNIGSVELVASMGTDLTVANAARVSFGKRKEFLEAGDIKLIQYLAKNKHWSPFRHVMFQFHIVAPEIVARQLYKHIVGISTSSPDHTVDHAWNEISGRYVIYEDKFYIPNIFRKQSKDNKQASTDEEVESQSTASAVYRDTISDAYANYKYLIELGVCKEQARGILPVSFYTEWWWTASLQATVNLIKLRDDPHAQWESRQYAIAMKELIQPIVPESFKALIENPL